MKQAIVIVHGMGDQTPMSTLNQFVEAVWETDETLVAGGRVDSTTGEPASINEVFAKPDSRTHNFELRRVTTQQDRNENRADFFEFYWAHHIQGTTWEHVKSWIVDLLWRWPRRVPSNVMNVWIASWILVVLMLAGIVWTSYLSLQPDEAERPFWNALKPFLPLLSLASSALVTWFISNIMVKRVGDVVRYTSARPHNVAIRQKIREAGVELLSELNRGNSYDRIIVVAHSLGAIVAFDVLTATFGRCNTQLDFDRKYSEALEKALEEGVEETDFTFTHQPALQAVEAIVDGAASTLRAGQQAELDLDDFQDAQREAQRELVAYGCPWKITDFITIGSPLTHAEFLVVDGDKELLNAQRKRLLPTCPPVQEYKGRKTGAFFLAYSTPELRKKPGNPRYPHHGAPFAFTRWTNIYSPRRWIIYGDIVSGPIGHLFGQPVKEKGKDNWHRLSGIREFSVLPERDADGKVLDGHKVPFMTHNSYWKRHAKTGAPDQVTDTPRHIRILRRALHLLET